MITHATRGITEGEEITSTYIKGLSTYEGRQKHLKELLAFQCQCHACILPPSQRQQSDKRTARINTILETLAVVKSWKNANICLPLVGELIDLYEQVRAPIGLQHKPTTLFGTSLQTSVTAKGQ